MAKTSLGRKRTGLNELGHHVLRKNHAGLLGSHIHVQKSCLSNHGFCNGLLKNIATHVLSSVAHWIDLITALLLVGRTCTKLSGRVKRGRRIHLTTAHLIAGKPNRVSEPLTSQEDWHLDSKACLRVKERGHMVVLQELCNQLRIGRRELRALLGKADTSRIHHGKVVAKRLQKLDRTGLKDRHIFFSWLPSK